MPIGSPENIDHILDNMFVQRPPYQPPTTRKSSSPSPSIDAGKTGPTESDTVPNTSAEPTSLTNSTVPDIENGLSVS